MFCLMSAVVWWTRYIERAYLEQDGDYNYTIGLEELCMITRVEDIGACESVHCVLCAVCCVLCAVCCVLCAVCCVLCAVCRDHGKCVWSWPGQRAVCTGYSCCMKFWMRTTTPCHLCTHFLAACPLLCCFRTLCSVGPRSCHVSPPMFSPSIPCCLSSDLWQPFSVPCPCHRGGVHQP
jgi:hypothetical protein